MESILKESEVGQGHEVPVVRGETFYETLKPRSRVTEDVTNQNSNIVFMHTKILYPVMKYCITALIFQLP